MKNFQRFLDSVFALALAGAFVSPTRGATLATTGATVTDLGDAELFTWSATGTVGTITIPEGGATFEALLVGGGGAGGFCRGGGGGGGGVVYEKAVRLEEGTYTITVGAGGVPDAWTPTGSDDPYKNSGSSTAGTDGGASILSNATESILVAFGGGGGGTFITGQNSAFSAYGNSGAGRTGASAGGSANKQASVAALGDGQGYAGGAAWSGADGASGGGGGAGGAGQSAFSNDKGGNGGAGYECSITGAAVVYGGGGGAGVYSGPGGVGGAGGGGNAGTGNGNPGMTPGTDGLGGGGGGASGSGNKWASCGGGAGGSGIVILRYVPPSLAPTVTDFSVETAGFTNAAFHAVVTSLGLEASSATMTVELSDTSTFAAIVGSASETLTELWDGSLEVAAPCDSSLFARLIVDNGAAAVTNGPVSFRTLPPVEIGGTGYEFRDGGLAVSAVVSVLRADACAISVYPDGAEEPAATTNVMAAGSFEMFLEGVSSETTLRLVFASFGTTNETTLTAVPGSSIHVVKAVADHASAATALRMHAGDKAFLPALPGGSAAYKVLNPRFATLAEENGTMVLTAHEPGIVGVECSDGSTVTTMGVIILPDRIGDGNIYIFNKDNNEYNTWNDAANWEKLGSETNDSWPQNPDDIAIFPFYSRSGNTRARLSNGCCVTNGAIYAGSMAAGKSVTLYLESLDTKAIGRYVFARTDGQPVRIQASQNDQSEKTFTVRFGGNATEFEYLSDTVFDGGWDGANGKFNRGRPAYPSSSTTLLPEGVTLVWRGIDSTGTDNSQTFTAPVVVGGGTVWNDSAATVKWNVDESRFTGLIRDSSHGNEGFWRSGPTLFESASLSNSCAEAIGFVYTSGAAPSINTVGNGYGMVCTGHDHNYGSSGYHPNWFPAKGLRLVNSTFWCGSTENASWGVGVAEVKKTDEFAVSRGFSFIYRASNRVNSSGHPINWFECSTLAHDGKGSIRINDFYRSDYVDPAATTNNVTILHGFAALASGGKGNPKTETTYPIVPWMVSPSKAAGGRIEFTSVDATDRICDFYFSNMELDSCTDPLQNVICYDKSKGLTLSGDRTVNSLSLHNVNKSKYIGGFFTLTITSGGLILHGNGSAIGTKDADSVKNGQLVLGDEIHPGYVFSDSTSATKPNEIWAPITAPGGLVFAYTGYALLGGHQTGIEDEIVVNAGVVDFGAQDGSASVTLGAPIRILPNATAKFNAVTGTETNDVCFDVLAGQIGRIELACNATCRRLMVREEPATNPKWLPLRKGTYGSSASAAQFKDDTMFSGTGILTVLSNETDEELYGALPRVARKDVTVGATWLSVEALVDSLGVGATALDVLMDVKTDADGLNPTNAVTTLTDAPQSVEGIMHGLDPQTVYRYVLRFTNGLEGGTNDITGTIETLADSSWMAPILSIKTLSAGFTSLSSSVLVSSLGTKSTAVSITAELATDETFANIVATEDLGVLTAPGEVPVTFNDLTFGQTYFIRYRAVSSKGEPAEVSQLCPPLVYPCNIGTVGARSTETNTVFTLPISELIEGVVVTVSFAAEGAPSATWTISNATTLVSPSVPYTPWGKATGYFSVAATVGDSTLPSILRELTVSRGQNMYTPASLAECDTIVLFPGDSLTLPELSVGDFYVLDENDAVSFADNVLTALEPGFCYVTRQTPDGAEGRYRSVDSSIVIVAPTEEMAPGGLFVCRVPSDGASSVTISWTDASKWTRVYGTGDYPNGADCCALITSRHAGETIVTTPADGVTLGFLGLASQSPAVRDPGSTRILLRGENPLVFQTENPDGGWVRLRGAQNRLSLQAFEVPLKLESDLAFDWLGGIPQDTKFRRNVDVGDHVLSTRRGAYADTDVGYSGHITFGQDVLGTGTIRLGADATGGWEEGSSRIKSFAGNIEVLNGKKTNVYGGISGLCMGQICLPNAKSLRVGGAYCANPNRGGTVLTGGSNSFWCWGWTNVWENPLPPTLIMDGGLLWLHPLGPTSSGIPGSINTHTFDSVTIQGAMSRLNSSFTNGGGGNGYLADMRTVIDDFYVEPGATMCFDLETSIKVGDSWTSTNVVIHTQEPDFGDQAMLRTDYFYPYLIPNFGSGHCTKGYVRATEADGVYEKGQIHTEDFDATEKSDGNLRRFSSTKGESISNGKTYVAMALDHNIKVSFARQAGKVYNVSGFVALTAESQLGTVGASASTSSSLCFEDRPAYFYVPNPSGSAYVGCRISGSAGLVKSSPGRLCLAASSASSLSGGVTVNCGTLALGCTLNGTAYAGRTGSNDITIQPGGTVEVNCSNGFDPATIVYLEKSEAMDLAGRMTLNTDITAARLYLGGESMELGTYGSSESPARFVDDNLFSGPGVLRVIMDDIKRPTQIILH